MLERVIKHNPSGGMHLFTEELGFAGWEQSHLSKTIPFEQWWNMQHEMLDNTQNVELFVRDSGRYVGGIVLVESEDAQIGKCITLFHQFLLPEYRNMPGLWREMFNICKDLTKSFGYSYMVHSHHIHHNLFKTIYTKV